MTTDREPAPWREAAVLEGLCRRLDEAEREAIAWEVVARPSQGPLEAVVPARV